MKWKCGSFCSVQTFLISETNNLTLQKQMVFSESLSIINLNIYKLRDIYAFLWVKKYSCNKLKCNNI